MYRVLLVEPDTDAREAVSRALADSPLPFAIDAVDDLDAAAAVTGDQPVDVVLLGAPEPHEAIARCCSLFSTRPVLVLSRTADLRFARAALRAGAQDVVVIQERSLAVLSRILLYAIERAGVETRRRALETEVATLKAMVDALFAHSRDGFVQLDAAGTIERLSPSAAELIGSEAPATPGSRLASRLNRRDAPRLTALLDRQRQADGATPVTVSVDGTARLLEIGTLPLDLAAGEAPRLLTLAELAADFAADPAEAAGTTTGAGSAGELARVGRPVARPVAPVVTPAPKPDRNGHDGSAAAGRPDGETLVAQRAEVEAAPPMAATTRPAALIEVLARTATWRIAESAGPGERWGFLMPDPRSAAAIARLATVGRDDPEIALALDELQLRAWQRLLSDASSRLPLLPVLEISYSTSASRSHLERFTAEIAGLPEDVAGASHLALTQVPKGVHVPTLGKTLRALEAGRGKPALRLPDLESDYRALALGQLALLILDVADLKHALAKDSKAVAGFLARARDADCRTLVRGAGGAVAEALRNRLGIDLTVHAWRHHGTGTSCALAGLFGSEARSVRHPSLDALSGDGLRVLGPSPTIRATSRLETGMFRRRLFSLGKAPSALRLRSRASRLRQLEPWRHSPASSLPRDREHRGCANDAIEPEAGRMGRNGALTSITAAKVSGCRLLTVRAASSRFSCDRRSNIAVAAAHRRGRRRSLPARSVIVRLSSSLGPWSTACPGPGQRAEAGAGGCIVSIAPADICFEARGAKRSAAASPGRRCWTRRRG